jgi:hypothetical protein
MSIIKGISILLTTLVLSFFTGFMFSTAGAALYPPINKVASPFICSAGQMKVVEQTYHPAPGETVTTQTWSCVDKGIGESREIGIPEMALFVIPIYALIVFFPFLVIVAIWQVLIRPSSLKKQQDTDMKSSLERYKAKVNSGQMSQEQYSLMEQSLKNYYDKKSMGSSAATGVYSFKDMVNSSANEPIEEQLKKLKGLLDSRLINEKDYEKKKAEILSKL